MLVSPLIPAPTLASALHAGRALMRSGQILDGLQALHDGLGDVFRLPLPGFSSVVLVGPEANRFLLTESREAFLWRAEGDPVTRLLREGILVTDGPFHDELRQTMTPPLHRSHFEQFIQVMSRTTDRISETWPGDARIDMLDEMRRITLCILTDTLFGESIEPQLDVLWGDILRTIRFISPGAWVVWPGVPRPGYRGALRRMDDYLYQLIAQRRAQSSTQPDLLSSLVESGMSDELIRDQLLTMLIAGHDTSTALLAWAFYLLTTHESVMVQVRAEIDRVLDGSQPDASTLRQLSVLDRVIKETLRLYPPIHLGSRIAATDITFRDYHILSGTRVLYSIYLTHRDKKYWADPDVFNPDRFTPGNDIRRQAYTFLPFGGGARNCIGSTFAQVEAKVVLACLLQRFDFRFAGGTVRPRMRATLEPYPGVLVETRRRPSIRISDSSPHYRK